MSQSVYLTVYDSMKRFVALCADANLTHACHNQVFQRMLYGTQGFGKSRKMLREAAYILIGKMMCEAVCLHSSSKLK